MKKPFCVPGILLILANSIHRPKPFKVLCLVSSILILLTGCKKDNDDQDVPEEFANTFLVERIDRIINNPEEVNHFYYEYDSLNRITKFDLAELIYNNDGTLKSVTYSYGDYMLFTYDGSKRISKLVYYLKTIEHNETIDFFYSKGDKPDSALYNSLNTIAKYTFGSDGKVNSINFRIDTIDYIVEQTWENGNLVRYYEPSNIEIKYEYDSNPNYAITMHLPPEYILMTELYLAVDIRIELLTKNNMIKETYFFGQNPPVTYIDSISEYNACGLPLKLTKRSQTSELIYEER